MIGKQWILLLEWVGGDVLSHHTLCQVHHQLTTAERCSPGWKRGQFLSSLHLYQAKAVASWTFFEFTLEIKALPHAGKSSVWH